MLSLSAVHIPTIEKWAMNFPSHQQLNPGEWAIQKFVWATPDLDLLASRFTKKLDRLVSRTSDPQAFSVDGLVTPWDPFSLIYASSLLQLLPRLLHRIKVEGILVILIALAWPRKMLYASIVDLLADVDYSKPTIFAISECDLPSCYKVAGFDNMAVEDQGKRERGVSGFGLAANQSTIS